MEQPVPAAVERLRILIVCPALPYPPIWGSGTRMYQLIRHLAHRHDVTVLAFAPPRSNAAVAVLRGLGARIETVTLPEAGALARRARQVASMLSRSSFARAALRSARMRRSLDELLSSARFDLVQLESSQMAGYRIDTDAPVLLDEHNIEYELLHRMWRGERSAGRRVFNWIEYRKFRREERAAWRAVDGCVLTSERERDIVAREAPACPTAVAANGVDTEYFRPTPIPIDPGSVVFTGLMSYRPNVDAAVFFATEVLPLIRAQRPEVSFTIVGAGPAPEVRRLEGRAIHVTGDVPDVRPYLGRASIVVAPVRMGSGTRLKVVEAMAMGRPVVATPLGCEGIAAIDGEHLLVADTAPALAAAVVRVLDDRALADALARNGRALVEARYGWGSIAASLERFYAEILAARRRATLADAV
jgi:sugar transferase (PEP-CTERM/EpsH1 system associated)